MKLLIYHFNTLTSQSDFFFLVAILSVPLGSPRQTHATPPLPAACYWDGEETLREVSHLGALAFSADLISGRHKGSLETVSSPPNTSQADKHFLKKRQTPSDPREDFPRERVGGWSKQRWQRRHRGAAFPFQFTLVQLLRGSLMNIKSYSSRCHSTFSVTPRIYRAALSSRD